MKFNLKSKPNNLSFLKETKEKESILEEKEIGELIDQIVKSTPSPGTQTRRKDVRFDSLPLSKRTLRGLAAEKLEFATEIQASSIPHALADRDILGAAKTGSGKTLAFVIPIIEKLYRERWSPEDGLAAIIISPTRELAFQIFDVLRKVGKMHHFSAGLVTGGKKEFNIEQEKIIRMNILVATPGRLLQHFEETFGFDASKLMILVLDEADRILDMGFKTQVDSILQYLPTERQTMLFSATQTKSVKDLARLSLKSPEYLAVHAEDNEVTPKQLVQNYIVCSLPEKLDILFSFIKSHLKSKMIIFFATCSQVRFVYECFRSMQPGVPLSSLHGKIKQERRTLIYMDFLQKKSACLIATDIASRGLDFPNVDWVIQVDAPEDSAMYIHRVGRTARFNSGGRSLLMLMPVEEAKVIQELKEAKIPIKRLTVNTKKTFSVSSKAAALLAAQPEYRVLGKKAFLGYLRSLKLLPLNRSINIADLPLDEFASSLGLPFTPELPGDLSPETLDNGEDAEAKREDIRKKKNINRSLDKLKKQIKEAKDLKKKEKALKKLKNKGDIDEKEYFNRLAALKANNEEKLDVESDNPSDDELFTVKNVYNWSQDDQAKELEVMNSKDKKDSDQSPNFEIKGQKNIVKTKISKDGTLKGVNPLSKKMVFDEDGNAIAKSYLIEKKDPLEANAKERITQYSEKIKQRIDQGRQEDLEREKQRIREKRLKSKNKSNEDQEEDTNTEVTLSKTPVLIEAETLSESDEEVSSSSELNLTENSSQRDYNSDSDTSSSSQSYKDNFNNKRKFSYSSYSSTYPKSKKSLSLKDAEAMALKILEE